MLVKERFPQGTEIHTMFCRGRSPGEADVECGQGYGLFVHPEIWNGRPTGDFCVSLGCRSNDRLVTVPNLAWAVSAMHFIGPQVTGAAQVRQARDFWNVHRPDVVWGERWDRRTGSIRGREHLHDEDPLFQFPDGRSEV
jgi:hypothetical protein